MSGWKATFCGHSRKLPGGHSDFSQFHEIGWSIAWVDKTGREYLIPLRFGRKRDAEIAVKAVCGIGPWPDEYNQIRRKIFDYGTRRFRELLCRDLAW